MKRKLLAIFIATIVAVSLLAGCGNKDEYGTVGDADISVEKHDKGFSIFTKQASPFDDYTYKNEQFECAAFAFDIPDSWRRMIYNQSCIRYDAPYDDPHFPGATFYVKCLYDYDASSEQLDPFAGDANEYGSPMSTYITGLPFAYDGKDTWIKTYTIADESEEPSFCNEKTAARIKTTRDVILLNRKTVDVTAIKDADFVAGYFRWDNFPVMIATVAPRESSADAKTMVEYIMSSVEEIPQKITKTKKHSYRKLNFTVPAEFEELQDSGNILLSSPQQLSSTAGMSIGVFDVPEYDGDISEDYFQMHYADNLAAALIDPACAGLYDISAASYENKGEKLADEKRSFLCTVNIIPKETDYLTATKTYGTVSVWMMDCYIVERNGKNYLIAAMYPRQEGAIAQRVLQNAIESFAVGTM